MSAIFSFAESSSAARYPTPEAFLPPVGLPSSDPRRTHLRVIEGGRSPRSMVRVYRRRRVIAALVAVCVVAALVLLGGELMDLVETTPVAPTPAAAVAASGTGPVLVVQEGDTLSSIARRLQPSGSVTALVDRLAAAHGPGLLQAGDRLDLSSIAHR